jgi:glutathione S-transferase
MSLELIVGNYNYSSWSMRAGVLLRAFLPDFHERMVHFDSFDDGSQFKAELRKISPTATVPVLCDHRRLDNAVQPLVVWDTLAIVEYIAEYCPDAPVWPRDPIARAQARSLCAEMHSGFGHLRGLCPMNIGPDLSHQGAILWRDNKGLQRDVMRIQAAWEDLLERYNGPFLCGEFGAIDAYFSPVVMRLTAYGLPVSERCKQYMDAVTSHPAVESWCDIARDTAVFIDFEEPYRLSDG